MKRILKFVSVAAAGLPLLVLAQGGISPVTPPATINIQQIINTVINWAFGLLIALAVLFIFYAAFLYLTAAGDAEKVKSASNYIIYAVIALVVAFAARGLVAIVRGLVGF